MEGWFHLTVGEFAGLSINPFSRGVGYFKKEGRMYVRVGVNSIPIEPEDEHQALEKLTKILG